MRECSPRFLLLKNEGISLSGLWGKILENDVVSDHLKLKISSQGSMDLKGPADNVDITLVGQGSFGFDLNSGICEILISGTGAVEITATMNY